MESHTTIFYKQLLVESDELYITEQLMLQVGKEVVGSRVKAAIP
jgi:hypothetical protein